MYSYTNILLWVNCSGCYMSVSPNPSNPLISPCSPYSPIIPYIPNELNQVKPFEPLGLSSSLKEIDFNALQCVERSRIEPIEPLELLR